MEDVDLSPVFITGGGGLLGWHLRARLTAEPAVVHAPSSSELDIRDAAAVTAAIADVRPRTVFHLAGQSVVAAAGDQARDTYETNVTGTFNLVDAIREHVPGAIVLLASSGRVYGDADGLPHAEHVPLAPRDPYAASKAAAEMLACGSGLATVAVRCTNIYGEFDRQPTRLVHELVAAAAERREPELRGDLGARRDFLHASDAAAAYIALARACADPIRCRGLAGHAVNVGSGRPLAIGEIVERVARLAAGDAPRSEPAWAHGPACDLLAEMTGLRPATTLDEGLERTLAWARAGRPQSPPG